MSNEFQKNIRDKPLDTRFCVFEFLILSQAKKTMVTILRGLKQEAKLLKNKWFCSYCCKKLLNTPSFSPKTRKFN